MNSQLFTPAKIMDYIEFGLDFWNLALFLDGSEAEVEQRIDESFGDTAKKIKTQLQANKGKPLTDEIFEVRGQIELKERKLSQINQRQEELRRIEKERKQIENEVQKLIAEIDKYNSCFDGCLNKLNKINREDRTKNNFASSVALMQRSIVPFCNDSNKLAEKQKKLSEIESKSESVQKEIQSNLDQNNSLEEQICALNEEIKELIEVYREMLSRYIATKQESRRIKKDYIYVGPGGEVSKNDFPHSQEPYDEAKMAMLIMAVLEKKDYLDLTVAEVRTLALVKELYDASTDERATILVFTSKKLEEAFRVLL